jgi:hypothetical protein
MKYFLGYENYPIYALAMIIEDSFHLEPPKNQNLSLALNEYILFKYIYTAIT